jgi:hypothetical protein
VIIQVPIPFSSKHLFLALEEDYNDHEKVMLQVKDVPYGLVSQRMTTHKDYHKRNIDALNMIYQELPGLIGARHCIRDVESGCVIF